MARWLTPGQEAKANAAANEILDALAAAKTEAECAAIAERSAKVFQRLEQVHPVRAIHIKNLAALRKAQFAQARRQASKAQQDLWA